MSNGVWRGFTVYVEPNCKHIYTLKEPEHVASLADDISTFIEQFSIVGYRRGIVQIYKNEMLYWAINISESANHWNLNGIVVAPSDKIDVVFVNQCPITNTFRINWMEPTFKQPKCNLTREVCDMVLP